MTDKTEAEDYSERCKNLDEMFQLVSLTELSEKVWVGVMMLRLKNLVRNQENPEEALEQLMSYLSKALQEG